MWNGDAANNGDIDDGASDSGMSENIDDDDEASDDDGPLNMDVVQHVLNQQLEHHHYHNFIHHRFEPDDETLSLDSGGDFNETKDSFHVYANPEPLESKAAQEIEWNDVDHIIADPTIKVEGITRDWISFDDVVGVPKITYKLLPYLPPQRKHKFTNQFEYMLNVVIPKLHQHEDSDIFTKLKPKRIHSDFKDPLERSLCLDLIEQRLIHCFYQSFAQCLHDFEALFVHNTFPPTFYDFTNKNSISTFFHKLLHRLPHEETEMTPPILKDYSQNLSISSAIITSKLGRKRRKHPSPSSPEASGDGAAPCKRRAPTLPTTDDFLIRFQSFSPSE